VPRASVRPAPESASSPADAALTTRLWLGLGDGDGLFGRFVLDRATVVQEALW